MTTLEEAPPLRDKAATLDSEFDVDINEVDLVDANGENFQDLDVAEIEPQVTEKTVTVSDSKTQSTDSSFTSPVAEVQSELATEKIQTQGIHEPNPVETSSNTTLPKEPTPATQPKRLLKLTGTSSTNTQITPSEATNAKAMDNSAKPRMIKLNTTSRSTAITNQAKQTQAAPKATQIPPNKATSTPQQKPKPKTPAPKATTTPTILPGSQNNFVLTPSPVGKSENIIKQVPKAQSSEPTTSSAQTNEKQVDSASKSFKVTEVASSQRSNGTSVWLHNAHNSGTWRKPVRIRAGYVPPEERANKLKQKDQEEDEEEIDIMTEELDADADSDTSQSQKANKRSAQYMDSDTDEPQRVRPNQGFISRLVNNNFTFNTKVFPMSLEDKNLLNDDGSAETLFKESTNNMIAAIDEMRRLQGIILLKHIARSYGIKIKIDENEDSEIAEISESETNDADGQDLKRRKLTSSMKEAIRKGRQVRIKQVQGAIGYKST